MVARGSIAQQRGIELLNKMKAFEAAQSAVEVEESQREWGRTNMGTKNEYLSQVMPSQKEICERAGDTDNEGAESSVSQVNKALQADLIEVN